MSKLKNAIDPSKNIAVFASAGTGKTYLLIHRILKLLLCDVAPANILAITFTRKAASEMQERLMKVLEDWAGFNDQELISALKNLAHTSDELSIAKAKSLYERILFSDYDVRITTFHAFCQDILKRFSIHADVPAGFRLEESTDKLKQEARESLFHNAQHVDEKKLSECIYLLLHHVSTVKNLNSILDTFIDSQNDWRSFVEGQTNAVEHANNCLQNTLFGTQEIIDQDEFYAILCKDLQQYQNYLTLHSGRNFKQYHQLITLFLDQKIYLDKDLKTLVSIFYDSKNNPREIKRSKAIEKSLGPEKLDKFIVLHEKLITLLTKQYDLIKKKNLLQFNQAWFYVGEKLLTEYQKLKFSRHILDFNDLEWHTYELLNKHESATWIQYKLDQRIEHILIDEFQDTNPTQWNLLLPLLEELAANLDEDANKSLFFVGDTKQSIYAFRRANPQLQTAALNWAKTKLSATLLETDLSYRSSPAIIDFVNKIFGDQNEPLLENYRPHQANFADIWGHVEISPLISAESDTQETEEKPKVKAPKTFRDPLLEARENYVFDSHYQEGLMVAKQIKQFLTEPLAIHTSTGARAACLSDIMILTRNRNHLASFELAFREQSINYKSVSEGDFLSQLEVQDILSLLTYLVQPHNDLALAQTLRSPCFSASDDDLMQLSRYLQTEINDSKKISWHERLNKYSTEHPKTLLAEANKILQQFEALANRIPVHDLLDKVFFELNIYQRYANSCPVNKRAQVAANLTHLLQLTLDIDAGRYSSIQSFLASIQEAKKIDLPNADSEHHSAAQEDALQIMTIHAAKGLEAPIVFLVNTATGPSQQHAYNTMIDWPSSSSKPIEFFIFGRKEDIDLNTQSKLDAQASKSWNEELNLLYVALTRAKQYLYISGVESKKGPKDSWFSTITSALKKIDKNIGDGAISFSSGKQPKVVCPPSSNKATKELETDLNLNQAFENTTSTTNQANTIDPLNAEQADYGTLVHKIFELADNQNLNDVDKLRLQVENSSARNINTDEFNNAYQEVKNCFQTTTLSALFNIPNKHKLLNEVPICFQQKNIAVTRIIDRIILTDDEVWIIDFKTTQQASLENLTQQAAQYWKQISDYIYAVKKLYPGRRIRASILFTAIATLYDYQIDEFT